MLELRRRGEQQQDAHRARGWAARKGVYGRWQQVTLGQVARKWRQLRPLPTPPHIRAQGWGSSRASGAGPGRREGTTASPTEAVSRAAGHGCRRVSLSQWGLWAEPLAASPASLPCGKAALAQKWAEFKVIQGLPPTPPTGKGNAPPPRPPTPLPPFRFRFPNRPAGNDFRVHTGQEGGTSVFLNGPAGNDFRVHTG